MKHVSILIPKGHSSLSNIDGTQHIFEEVNNIRLSRDEEPLFDVNLVGLARETTIREGMYTINPNCLVSEVEKTDLIVIPAVFGDMRIAFEENEPFAPWIIKQYNGGAEIVSFCIGSFFLAKTGLLNGKQCSTHWRYANEFRNMFPEAELVDGKILTEDDGIYTSGGAYAYLNLVIYLVEKFAGREMAILIAKAFMIDMDRHSQSPFIMFQGQKSHEDEEIKKAQEFIETNFQEKITVDQLAAQLCIGRRNLERRFKKATSNTVVEYIQRVKVEAAKKSFETSRRNINEIMYDVGYSDVKAFRTIFRKITGLSPLEYRNKYNREAIVA